MTTQDPTATAPDGVYPASPEKCPVCPHRWADHDVIGRRFCTATIASSRPGHGCVCRTAD